MNALILNISKEARLPYSSLQKFALKIKP